MSATFILLQDFTPPRDRVQAAALGLSPACSSHGITGVFLRFEGLPENHSRHLATAVRRCGGWVETMPRHGSAPALAAGLPHAARNAIVTELERSGGPRDGLVAEIRRALQAARREQREWKLAGLPLGKRTLIQGILNVTPDSFHDGGRWSTPRRAVARALQMEEEGADLIDVGGESTRPGSRAVGAAEEMRRVLPVIEALQGRLRIPISIDTTKSEVARRALQAGARIVNDVSGLSFDPAMAGAAAGHRAALIVSHIRGRPRTMMSRPRYRHLVPEVVGFLQESVRAARAAGVAPEAILVDPGLGFGKTASHNLLLLHYLRALHSTGCPILVGASRKSFLARLLGESSDRRLHGSLAVAALSVLRGAAVLRVHDVAPTVTIVRVAEAVRRARLES